MPGFDYTGAGNSTSKKDAHANAAQDFCAYLVRSGKMREDQLPGPGAGGEAPGGGVSRPAIGGTPGGAPHQHLGLTPAPVFREGFGPGALGPAYQRPGQAPGQGDFSKDFLQANAKQVTNVMTSIHSRENCRHGLSNQLFRLKRQSQQTQMLESMAIGQWRMPRASCTSSSKRGTSGPTMCTA